MHLTYNVHDLKDRKERKDLQFYADYFYTITNKEIESLQKNYTLYLNREECEKELLKLNNNNLRIITVKVTEKPHNSHKLQDRLDRQQARLNTHVVGYRGTTKQFLKDKIF